MSGAVFGEDMRRLDTLGVIDMGLPYLDTGRDWMTIVNTHGLMDLVAHWIFKQRWAPLPAFHTSLGGSSLRLPSTRV